MRGISIVVCAAIAQEDRHCVYNNKGFSDFLGAEVKNYGTSGTVERFR
jgi:hypothetical protein